jgi:hypothetical protein
MSIPSNITTIMGASLIIGRVAFAVFRAVAPSKTPPQIGGGFAGLGVVCLGVLLLVIGSLTGH